MRGCDRASLLPTPRHAAETTGYPILLLLSSLVMLSCTKMADNGTVEHSPHAAGEQILAAARIRLSPVGQFFVGMPAAWPMLGTSRCVSTRRRSWDDGGRI